jgi:dTMP kinase
MPAWWVTVEGIEGVGKTYLAGQLAARLGRGCRLLGEVTDAASGSLTSQVITALSRTGDLWLRTGHPVTETLALLALKVAEYERFQAHGGEDGIVLEDRGIDSVAIYQALVLAGAGAPDTAIRQAMELVYATAARWRPPPDRTILLVDDTATCLSRLQERTGAAVSRQDQALVARAAELYARQAAREPERFRVIRRTGKNPEETIGDLVAACTLQPAGRP